MAKKTQTEKAAQNDEKANDDPINDDEEPNFSDPEGFVDDISDEGNFDFLLTIRNMSTLVARILLQASEFQCFNSQCGMRYFFKNRCLSH
jgi:hypothetical protein